MMNFEQIIDGPNSFTLRNVAAFDGERVVQNAVVVVEHGKVARICSQVSPDCPAPSNGDVNGNGGFLMPALIDAEGHFTLANDMLRDGLEKSENVCAVINGARRVVRPSKTALIKEFAQRGLFEEVDTHGLIAHFPHAPHEIGKRYPIPQSANFEKHIRFGVTTVFDMHSYPWPASYVRRSNGRWQSPNSAADRDLKKQFLIYADLFYPSMWAMPHNLQFHYFGVDPVYNVQPDGPWSEDNVDRWVADRKAEGAHHVKIFYEDFGSGGTGPLIFTARTVAALTDAAHRHGLKVIAHLQSPLLVDSALRARVDAFMHTPGVGLSLLDPSLIERMAAGLKFIVPTMQGWLSGCDNPYSISNRFSHYLSRKTPDASFLANVIESPDVLPYINALDEIRIASCGPPSEGSSEFETIMKNVAAIADSGLSMLIGVDAGDEIFPLIEGLGVHTEMYVMREALLRYSKRFDSNEEATLFVLKAATSNAARAFDMHLESGARPDSDPRGFIRPGYRADLILLRDSPFEDIHNTLKIERVWKAGYVANRQMVRPECVSASCASRRAIRAVEAEGCKD